jgi:UDPglucose 6-dehydrogenase
VADRLPPHGSVALLGLSYKPNTDVVEESPGLHLARTLGEREIDVTAFDPAAVPTARRALDGSSIRFAESVDDAIRDADVVVVTTAWPEFATLDLGVFEDGRKRCVIDCWRVLDRERVGALSTYVALGESLNPDRETANAEA